MDYGLGISWNHFLSGETSDSETNIKWNELLLNPVFGFLVAHDHHRHETNYSFVALVPAKPTLAR